MSADDWCECPVCEKELKDKIKDSYGKVSEEEYKALKKELDELKESVSVYHEYNLNKDGTYSFDFGADCERCGTNFEEEK